MWWTRSFGPGSGPPPRISLARRRNAAIRGAFTSFSEAAEENAISRILVGFHFRNAVEQGVKHGRRIGNLAVSKFMRALP